MSNSKHNPLIYYHGESVEQRVNKIVNTFKNLEQAKQVERRKTTMTNEEKLLLLELILQDIRGNWGWNLDDRVDRALELAEELELDEFINSIKEYEEECESGDNDGRFFRMTYQYGGYEGMDELHGLSHTIIDKSDEFKAEIYILTYPENRFDDWDDYENK